MRRVDRQSCLRCGNAFPHGIAFPHVRTWLAVALLALGWTAGATAQNAPGDVIGNTARATYAAGTRTALTTDSNAVTLTVVPVATPATLDLMRHRPGVRAALAVPVAGTDYSTSGDPAGPWALAPAPAPPGGTPIDLTEPVPLVSADTYYRGEPVFLHLVDPDRDRDARVADTVLLEVSNPALGDRELLRLTETGPATGAFLGYLQTTGPEAPQAKDGLLAVGQDHELTAAYVDPDDPADRAVATAAVDPVGRIFDSRTGEPLSGVTVRLVDDATGLPAAVHGVDAVSAFPADVVTGAPLTDAAGHAYDFGPGGYRFPHVPDGRYRLEIDAPRATGRRRAWTTPRCRPRRAAPGTWWIRPAAAGPSSPPACRCASTSPSTASTATSS